MPAVPDTPCVFVLGPEGSGSTYAARRVSSLLGIDGWSGLGFNCCDAWNCAGNRTLDAPCRPVAALVCHRSLPFAGRWPDIDAWRSRYDCRFVLCTRDRGLAELSAMRRFGTRRSVARANTERAAGILAQVLASDAPCFLWSYESRDLLGEAYERELARFLGASPQPAPAEKFTPGNDGYRRRFSVVPAIVLGRIRRRLRRFAQ